MSVFGDPGSPWLCGSICAAIACGALRPALERSACFGVGASKRYGASSAERDPTPATIGQQLSKSWIALPSASWTRERLHIAGEWPAALAVADLRFWADPLAPHNGMTRPSVRALALTWGWKRGRVHALIQDSPRWEDDRTATGQRPDSDRTADQGINGAINRESDSDRTATGQRPDSAPISTRAQNTNTNTNTPIRSSKEDVDFERAAKRYAELAPARGLKGRRPARKGRPGQSMAARIREHGIEDVLRVLDWWATSSHSRASFLRREGIGLRTIMSPEKFETYSQMSKTSPSASSAPGEWIEPTDTRCKSTHVPGRPCSVCGTTPPIARPLPSLDLAGF